MKAIIFSYWFEAPDELSDFCKSIGYNNPDYLNDCNIMFDTRVIEFCEQRLTNLLKEDVYKGRTNHRFRLGFAGAGYIREIDTTKRWRIKYSNVDAPIIDYIDIRINDYGHVSVVSQ